MNVRFTPQAEGDLIQIRDYIADFDPAAAERVIVRIRQVVEIFEHFPLLGKEGRIDGTREFAIPGLPYIIIYRIASEVDLDILTIIHGRRHFPLLAP